MRSLLAEHAQSKSEMGDDWTPAITALQGREFVVCVGTLSDQKNQALLVQTWQLLMCNGVELPTLVLVGRRGHNIDDLMSQLATTNNLDGRVQIFEISNYDRASEARYRPTHPEFCERRLTDEFAQAIRGMKSWI
jgi:hypothetical protein